jgi:hypothetical protein
MFTEYSGEPLKTSFGAGDGVLPVLQPVVGAFRAETRVVFYEVLVMFAEVEAVLGPVPLLL